MLRSRGTASPITAILAGTLAVGALLALLLGAFSSGGNGPSVRVSAREARQLAEGGTSPAPPRGRPVTVSVGASRPRAPVPTNFLGLSFEATATRLIAAYGHAGNLATLMRSLGGGLIRLGGVSVDRRVAWSPSGVARPAWATVGVTRQDLAGIAALARQTGWSVLLTVDLGHYDPAAAAQEVAAAHALLGARLAGVEIGNEPDRYGRESLRGPGWGWAEYEHEVDAYRGAISRTAPGVPVVAPDASSGIPPLPWVSGATSLHPALLTDHYYPLSSCDGEEPGVSELLSAVVRRHEGAMLARLIAIEQASAVPLRIDETNSVSCRGRPGVSNSFASALWAADWTARAMAAGITGVNFHDLLTESSSYSPLVLANQVRPASAGGASAPPAAPGAHGARPTAANRGSPSPSELHANPDWYALLLTAGLAGARPVSSRVDGGSSSLSVAAFLGGENATRRSPHGRQLRLVLVDFEPPGAEPLAVHLQVPNDVSGGSILRLLAPSPSALSHVELGGSEVGPSGTWRPKLPLPRVYNGSRTGLAFEMPPSSAALVTLTPSPAAGSH
jgi:hypothetical protein